MNAKEVVLQIEGILKLQDTLLENIEKKRREYAEKKIAYEKEKDEMTKIHRQKTMEYAVNPSINEAIDPRTGRSNKDWSQFLLDEALEDDKEYINQYAKVWEAQQEMFSSEADQLILAEKLGVTKTQSRLLAALLEYASGDA